MYTEFIVEELKMPIAVVVYHVNIAAGIPHAWVVEKIWIYQFYVYNIKEKNGILKCNFKIPHKKLLPQ